MKVHPIADLYPMLEGEDYEALKQSIALEGQTTPITVDPEGVLLDGRNRLRACRQLGITPTARIHSGDAKAYVMAANENRRHMDRGQRAAMAALAGWDRPKGTTQTTWDRAQELAAKHPDAAKQVVRAGHLVAVHNAKCRPKQPKPKAARKPKAVLVEHRQRDKISSQRKEIHQLTEELAREQASSALFEELSGRPLPPVPRLERASGLREGTAVALLSDLHVETLVKYGDVPNGNIYTLGIAEHRLQRAFAGIDWLIQASQSNFKVRHLVLWLGGDLITNHLHPENVETAQLGPTSSLLWVQDRIIAGIQMLLDSDTQLELIKIPCSYGNHGRTTKKMRTATSAEHSWEWLLYQAVAAHFRDEPRVEVLADKTAHQYVQVYDFHLHFHHGHDVRYQGGVGGITIPMNKAVTGWDQVKKCDYHNFGHFHQYVDLGRFAVNGSLIGYDTYSMSIKCSPEVAQQTFYVLDSMRGKTFRSPIWVEDAEWEKAHWEQVKGKYVC